MNEIKPALAYCLFGLSLLAIVGCVRQETDETAIGTVGKQIVKSAVETVTKAQHDRVLSQRDKAVADATARALALAQAEKALELREAALARQAEVERELRRELDDIKADREVLHAHLDTIATHNVSEACPLGSAARINAVLVWLRDRAAGH